METLSFRLVEQGNLKTVLAAPAAAPVAAALQHMYCHGSLLTHFCSRSAVMHTPAAVSGFLFGLGIVAGAVPGTAIDSEPLKELAGYVDSAVEAAAQYQKGDGGKCDRWEGHAAWAVVCTR